MNGLPYYKRYPRDIFEGTIGMPLELKGPYSLILDLIYMQNGKLPDDARYISGLLGCGVRQWNLIRQKLIDIGKIETRDGYLGNFRADKELLSSHLFQDKQRENGAKSNKVKGLDKAMAEPKRSQPEPEPESEKKERDTNVSLVDHTVSDAFRLFNESAERVGWPKCSAKNKSRVSSLKRRLKEVGGIEGWRIALEKAEASDFLCNRVPSSPFKATIDFLLKPAKFTCLMEGNYDNRGTPAKRDQRAERLDGMLGAFAEVERDRRGEYSGGQGGGEGFGRSGINGDDSQRNGAAIGSLLDLRPAPRNGEA